MEADIATKIAAALVDDSGSHGWFDDESHEDAQKQRVVLTTRWGNIIRDQLLKTLGFLPDHVGPTQ